jgi:hypothetical protein
MVSAAHIGTLPKAVDDILGALKGFYRFPAVDDMK